jgi:hypothetical protein
MTDKPPGGTLMGSTGRLFSFLVRNHSILQVDQDYSISVAAMPDHFLIFSVLALLHAE